MANCPKCNEHLRLIDWKQTCPHCGANIVLYDIQERLMLDADKAEVENYHFQKKIDRLKASFAGNKLAVARIFTSLLPIGALFLPLVKANFSAPMPEKSGSITVLDIYNMFGDLNIGKLLGSFGDNALFLVSAILFLLSVVLILVHFILLTLACSPKGKVRAYVLNTLMLGFSVASAVCFMLSPTGSCGYGSLSVGTFLYIALFIVNFVLEIIIYKKGIEIHHKQCYVGGIPIEEYFEMVENCISHEELRKEMYKRLSEIQAQKDKELAEKEQAEKEKKEKENEVSANG